MNQLVLIATLFLTIHAASGYVLLTANIDDLKNIAQQLVQSPLGGKVKKIFRRAHTVFNQQRDAEDRAMRSRDQQRGTDDKYNDMLMRRKNYDDPIDGKGDNDDMFSSKNTSFYLNMIKKVFENM